MSGKSFTLEGAKTVLRPKDLNDLWEGEWEILKKEKDPEVLGYLTFKGQKELGTVPIYMEITDETRRNLGYGTDALKTIKLWALRHKNVYEIKASCDPHNSGAIMAMQKAGFVYRDGDMNVENYSVTRQKTSWMGLYFCIGIVIGLILALATSLTWASLIVSVLVCLGAGAAMDKKEEAYRKKITGKAE